MTKRVRPWGYQDSTDAAPANWALHPDTVAVRGGLARTGYGETGEALFLNSGFTYDSAEQAEAAFKEETEHFVYSRFANPTVATFEARIAQIEGAEAALATSTGMSAMFASVACLVQAGDRIVSSASMFSSCYVVLTEILPKWGVQIELVEGNDKKVWAAALSQPTKVVFIESPSNPMMQIVDIRMVSDLAHKVGATVIVDNVLASPVLQKPLDLGADVVMYSATKHIDGQGRVLGGVICGRKDYIHGVLRQFTRHTGPTMGAFEAWVLTKSLETMSMRVERMSSSALEIAKFLEGNKKASAVRYPWLKSHPDFSIAKKQMRGGGSTIAITFKGDKSKVFKFMNALQGGHGFLVQVDKGDGLFLFGHDEQMGITESTVRLSVGLEHPSDLIRDIEQALKQL